MSSTTAITLVAIPLVTAALYYSFVQHDKGYPPGPRGVPFFGNLFGMPSSHVLQTFSRWASQYGDIVHLKLLNKHVIILNSSQAVHDLLDRRSSIYSDRPHFPLSDVAGLSFNYGFLTYGKQYSIRRRTFATQFGRTSPDTYPSHYFAVNNLLRSLHERPEGFMDHLQLHASQLVIRVVYGLTVTSCDDRLISSAKTMSRLTDLVCRPEMWIVDPLPFLNRLPRWLGGRYFERCVEQWQYDTKEFSQRPYKLYLENDNGLGADCFMKKLLDAPIPSIATQERVPFAADCAASAYGGASGNTVTSARSFFLAMAVYPDVQRKAQAQIDEVVGDGRLPDFNDRPALPYISAIVREVLRWNPPVPKGIPHALRNDDEYQGYHLPKGSIVMANVWHILHDPAVYAEPEQFVPERHLADGVLLPEDPSRIAFGFGRRICPGRAFAEDALWLLVARVMAVYDIKPTKNGRPQAKFTSATGSATYSHPLPFECDIVARSDKVLTLF
ncbi:cytochrome P450 [Peniophora sp. CONT]|nr:cytochrome P450 [Peniophora sp. CONT]